MEQEESLDEILDSLEVNKDKFPEQRHDCYDKGFYCQKCESLYDEKVPAEEFVIDIAQNNKKIPLCTECAEDWRECLEGGFIDSMEDF